MIALTTLLAIYFILATYNAVDAKKGACAVCLCYWRNNVKFTDCSYLGLSTIPAGISLKTGKLYLNGNNITDVGITSSFGNINLPRMRSIYLHNNPISQISPTAFQHVTQINTLLLHYTEVETFPEGLFSNLTKLKYLWVNNAMVTNISSTTFKGLKKLEEIMLDSNALQVIPNGAFKDQSSLKSLHLQKNEAITEVPSCCQMCDLPSTKDIKWGMVPIDTELSCGCDGPIECASPELGSFTCYANACVRYKFSSARSLLKNTLQILVGSIVAVASILLTTELIML